EQIQQEINRFAMFVCLCRPHPAPRVKAPSRVNSVAAQRGRHYESQSVNLAALAGREGSGAAAAWESISRCMASGLGSPLRLELQWESDLPRSRELSPRPGAPSGRRA